MVTIDAFGAYTAGAKTAFWNNFCAKNDLFAKPGSGQT
jgi:hypothetical protein